MKNETNRKITLKLMTLVVLGSCLLVYSRPNYRGPFAAGGQSNRRLINRALSRNDVIELTEIKVSQKEVKLGEEFDGDEQWMKAIVVKIKNISNKPMVYLRFNVNFPETRETGSMMSYPVQFGQKPLSTFPQDREPMLLSPGETMEVVLEKHYSEIASFVGLRKPIANIHKAEFEIGFVIFADKTAWMAGQYMRQDPNNSDRYLPVGP